MITLPVRLDRLELAMTTVLDAAHDPAVVVGWAYGEALWRDNFPGRQAVNLVLSAGPGHHEQTIAAAVPIAVPSSLTATVLDATPGRRYILQINEFDYSTNGQAGDTVTTIRDRLLADIVADEMSALAAAAAGPDQVVVTPTPVGAIWQVGRKALDVDVTTAAQAYLLHRQSRRMTCTVGCYSRGRAPSDGAWNLMAVTLAALASESSAQTFARYGVGLWGRGEPLDLSGLDNAHWLTRVEFDLAVAMKSIHTEPTDVIEAAAITLDLADPAVTETIP